MSALARGDEVRRVARPAEGAIENFKKVSPRVWGQSHEKTLDCQTIEIWFADEARVGQKNKITRRWAKRGTRPIAPRDQRTASTYIFGAVCPHQGRGAALILLACNTEAMNLHLAEIAKAVAPDAHAVLLVDQAGWHLSTRLVVPANITIIFRCRRSAPSSTRSKTSGSPWSRQRLHARCSRVTLWHKVERNHIRRGGANRLALTSAIAQRRKQGLGGEPSNELCGR
jgi:DDE superfamily endonuclease